MRRVVGVVRHPATFIALAALAVRVLWLVMQGPTEITWDGAEYARTAENLLHGHGFVGMHGTPMVIFPPMYSLFIAALIPLTGSGEAAGVIVSLLAGATIVLPVYAIARRLYRPEAGIAAAAIVACLPFAVDMSTIVLSDALFACLAASALYYLIRTLQEGGLRDAVAAAAFFGVAYLTRPEGLVMAAAGGVAGAVAFALLPALRRNLVRCGALYVVVLAVIAAPYVAYLSGKAHALRFEGKSAINATIGERMRAGMSYVQAADAVDDRLDLIGPELDDDGYFADRWVRPIWWRGRLALLAVDFRRRLVDVPRTLVTRPYGTPLVPVLALVGLIAGPWTRRRAAGEVAAIGYAIALFLSLTSVYHFWARYAFGFTPLIAVWAGHGVATVGALLVRRGRVVDRSGGRPYAAAAAAFAALCLVLAVTEHRWFRDNVNDATPLAEREAGRWIAAHAPDPGALILSVSDQSVYYARGAWSMLPYAPGAGVALRYVRAKDPRYVILDRSLADQRPYITQWLDHGVPLPGARLIHRIGDPAAPELAIYQLPSRPSADGAMGLLDQRSGPTGTSSHDVAPSTL